MTLMEGFGQVKDGEKNNLMPALMEDGWVFILAFVFGLFLYHVSCSSWKIPFCTHE